MATLSALLAPSGLAPSLPLAMPVVPLSVAPAELRPADPAAEALLRELVRYRYREVPEPLRLAAAELRAMREAPVDAELAELKTKGEAMVKRIAEVRAELARLTADQAEILDAQKKLQQRVEPEKQKKRKLDETLSADPAFKAICVSLELSPARVLAEVKSFLDA